MLAKCGMGGEPGDKSVTESLHPALAFRHQGPAWDILWQKGKHRKV